MKATNRHTRGIHGVQCSGCHQLLSRGCEPWCSRQRPMRVNGESPEHEARRFAAGYVPPPPFDERAELLATLKAGGLTPRPAFIHDGYHIGDQLFIGLAGLRAAVETAISVGRRAFGPTGKTEPGAFRALEADVLAYAEICAHCGLIPPNESPHRGNCPADYGACGCAKCSKVRAEVRARCDGPDERAALLAELEALGCHAVKASGCDGYIVDGYLFLGADPLHRAVADARKRKAESGAVDGAPGWKVVDDTFSLGWLRVIGPDGNGYSGFSNRANAERFARERCERDEGKAAGGVDFTVPRGWNRIRDGYWSTGGNDSWPFVERGSGGMYSGVRGLNSIKDFASPYAAMLWALGCAVGITGELTAFSATVISDRGRARGVHHVRSNEQAVALIEALTADSEVRG